MGAGLGSPHPSPEMMRDNSLYTAIMSGNLESKDNIVTAAVLSIIAQKGIATDNRYANHANTKMMVDAILGGASYVQQGLLQIASELRYSNILTERRDLETKIRNTEDWLFDKGFMKDFYQTAELSGKIIPFVNASHFCFLDRVCQINRRKIEHVMFKSGWSEEDVKKDLQASKKRLCRFSLNMMCHPLVTLAYLISTNGLLFDSGKISIAGLSYDWEPNDHKIQNCGNEIICDFGERKIIFKKKIIFNSPYYVTRLTFEDALPNLIQAATNFENDFGCCNIDTKLEWIAFFDELNMNIAMYNLRTLAQSLESFKRQKRLELS